MIANAAVMVLLMQQEKRNGWDPYGNDRGPFDFLMILFFTIVAALIILWVLS